MSDLPFNNPVFKKLGINSTNQWMFYDKSFEKFFRWFADNITEENLISEEELLEVEDIKERGLYLVGAELENKVQELEAEHPGLFTSSKSDIELIEQEISAYEEANAEYAALTKQIHKVEEAVNTQLKDYKNKIDILEHEEKEWREKCLNNATKLDKLQGDNAKLIQEAFECFSKVESPPLFIHQMPLEAYVRKCDKFVHEVEHYLLEQHKFEDDEGDDHNMEMLKNLENLQISLEYYMLESIKESTLAEATKAMVDGMNIKHVHIENSTELKREISRLELENDRLCTEYDDLLEELDFAVQKHASQKVEMVLFENTNSKLKRAEKSYAKDQLVLNMVKECMSYAELLWAGTQLDLERWRNLTELYNTQEIRNDTSAIAQRMKLMRNMPVSDECTIFFTQMAELLSQHLNENIKPDPKQCLQEYEKIMRLYEHNLQNFDSDKCNARISEQIEQMMETKKFLKSILFDGPTNRPFRQRVRFMNRIENVKINLKELVNKSRDIRLNYHQNVTERFKKDKLWRYSQLLWMWFLTEPELMLVAIEEVKKAASETLSYKGGKTLMGIKRKD